MIHDCNAAWTGTAEDDGRGMGGEVRRQMTPESGMTADRGTAEEDARHKMTPDTADRGTPQDDARHAPPPPSPQLGKGGEGAVSDGEGVNDVASREGAGRDSNVRASDIKLVVPQVWYKHVIFVALFLVRFF